MPSCFKKIERHESIFRLLQTRPGLSIIEIAKALGLSGDQVRTVLPAMENSGFLLSEDGHGRLYPYYLVDLEQERREWASALNRAGFSAPTIVEMIYGYRDSTRAKRIRKWLG